MIDSDQVRIAPLGAVTIAPMRRRHLRGVVRIEQQTNHRPWSMGLFATELEMPTSRYYVVAIDGPVVVGYGGIMWTLPEAHLTNIATDPVHHRRGIGTAMMLDLARAAIDVGVTEMTLEVRASNSSAQELYRRFGFAPGGIRRNYYSHIGEDALIMWAHDMATSAYRRRLESIDPNTSAGPDVTLGAPLRPSDPAPRPIDP